MKVGALFKVVKRAIKFILSIGFWAFYASFNRIRKLLKWRGCGTCVVICYHEVDAQKRQKFSKQLDVLEHLSKFVSINELGKLRNCSHNVAITFDDGFMSVMENAIPELVKRKIPSTLFIPCGYLGKYPGWMQTNQNSSKKIINEDQLKSLDQKLVSIGSHGVSHQNLTLMNEEMAERELVESKRILEKILGYPIIYFAFPYGRYNQNVINYSKKAGYKRIFSIWPEMAMMGSDEYLIGRVDVSTEDWPFEFMLKSLGAYRWLATVYELKRKLYNYLKI